MTQKLRELLLLKTAPQDEAMDTFMAFLFMSTCLAVCGVINGYVLVAGGAADSIFRYLLRETHLSLILLLPVLLPGLFSRVYSVILYLCAAAFTAANWLHFSLYNAPISSYIASVMKETYFGEAYEFTLQFISAKAVFIGVAAFLLPLPFLILSLRKERRSRAMGLLILFAVTALIGIRLINKDFSSIARWNYMADFAVSCAESRKAAAEFNAALTSNNKLPGNISKSGAPGRIIVLVIGESSSRHHYSLYGYTRRTTPNLDALRPELLVFSDVISAHAHTIPALQEALTVGVSENPPARYALIPILKAAGYRTIVLSNQPLLGKNDSAATTLLGMADELRYFNLSNPNGMYAPTAPDGLMLPEFEKKLTQPGDLVIVLHLMGSHSKYNMRIPESAPRFTNTPPYAVGQNLSSGEIETINEYDASIAYTDIVLSGLLDALKRQKRPSALLYFSDHGEALYEDGETLGHAEGAEYKYMYDIPFLIWLSPEYRQSFPELSHAVPGYLDRPWQNSDLAYPVLSLAGVSFAGFDPRRDILSPSFIPQRRLINNKNYAKLFPIPGSPAPASQARP